MGLILLMPVLYAAAVLQTSLVDLLEVGRVAPDLVALAAVMWLLTAAPGPKTLLVAGAIGFLEDLVSPGCTGPGMICFLLVGYAVVRVRSRFALDQVAWQVSVVWLAVTALALGLAVARWLLGELSLGLRAAAVGACGVGVYTAGVSLPVAMVLGWIVESRRTREKRLAEL